MRFWRAEVCSSSHVDPQNKRSLGSCLGLESDEYNGFRMRDGLALEESESSWFHTRDIRLSDLKGLRLCTVCSFPQRG